MTPRHELPTPGPAAEIAAVFQALVPLLTTDRLVLRAPRLSDFPAYREIVCTDRGAYVGGPMSRDDGWFDFAGMMANWMLHGHGGWTVEDSATLDVLGFVALGLEPGDREVELGYIFRAPAEGKGFATEAVRAVRNWAFDELHLPTLVSYIDRENTRSVALAARLGAFDDTPPSWTPEDVVYRHINPAARA